MKATNENCKQCKSNSSVISSIKANNLTIILIID